MEWDILTLDFNRTFKAIVDDGGVLTLPNQWINGLGKNYYTYWILGQMKVKNLTDPFKLLEQRGIKGKKSY